MKRSVVLCASLLVLALIPGLASAQGWLLPGLPSFGGNGCGSCYGNLGGVSIGGDVAYVGYSRATVIDFTAQGPGLIIGGERAWKQSYPVHGIQLSGMATAAANDRVTLIARGTWLFPWNGESFEEYNFGGGFGQGRHWSTSTQWWTVDGAGAFAFSGSAAAIGGLRYDSFMTNFKDPSDQFGINGRAGDEADVQASLWIPYGGVLVHHGGAKFGVIGFPWVPGTIKYGQTIGGTNVRLNGSGAVKSGYFLEAFAEFNANLMGASAGVFAKYTYVRAKAQVDMDRSPSTDNDTFDVVLDRPNWIFGAQAKLNFSSPF